MNVFLYRNSLQGVSSQTLVLETKPMMLRYISLPALALLACGAMAQRPANPEPGLQVPGRVVSGAWLLRNDPNFLGDGLTRGGAARSALIGSFPAHLRAIISGAVQQPNSGRQAPAEPVESPRGMVSNRTYGLLSIPGLFKLTPKVQADHDMGSTLLNSVASTRTFTSVAVADGLVKVDATGAAAFNWGFLRTYTGEIKNGSPVIDKQAPFQNGKAELPIQAGQEYAIVGANNSKTDGAKTGVLTVADGTRLTVNVRGDVYKPNGSVTYGASTGFMLKPGAAQEVQVPFEVSGNTATTVQLSLKSPIPGITVTGLSPISVGAQGKGVFKVRMTAAKTMADWSGMAKFSIRAFNGAAEGPLDIPVKVETRWAFWPDWSLKAGDITHKGSLKVADTGYFLASIYFSTSSIVIPDNPDFGLAFNAPYNSQGNQLGLTYVGSMGATIDPGSSKWKSLIMESSHATLADQFDKLVNGGLSAYLTVDSNKFAAWQAARKLTLMGTNWIQTGKGT